MLSMPGGARMALVRSRLCTRRVPRMRPRMDIAEQPGVVAAAVSVGTGPSVRGPGESVRIGVA